MKLITEYDPLIYFIAEAMCIFYQTEGKMSNMQVNLT